MTNVRKTLPAWTESAWTLATAARVQNASCPTTGQCVNVPKALSAILRLSANLSDANLTLNAKIVKPAVTESVSILVSWMIHVVPMLNATLSGMWPTADVSADTTEIHSEDVFLSDASQIQNAPWTEPARTETASTHVKPVIPVRNMPTAWSANTWLSAGVRSATPEIPTDPVFPLLLPSVLKTRTAHQAKSATMRNVQTLARNSRPVLPLPRAGWSIRCQSGTPS